VAGHDVDEVLVVFHVHSSCSIERTPCRGGAAGVGGSFALLRMTESGSIWRPLPPVFVLYDSKWELSASAEGFFFGLVGFFLARGSRG